MQQHNIYTIFEEEKTFIFYYSDIFLIPGQEEGAKCCVSLINFKKWDISHWHI